MTTRHNFDDDDAGPGQFRLWDPSEIYDIPRPEWAIEEIILKKGSTLLYGPTNVGKSLMALDWGMRLALGLDWFSQEVKRPYKVAYVYAEGAAGLQLRYRAYVEGFALEPYEHLLMENIRFLGLEEQLILTPGRDTPSGKQWEKFMATFTHWRPDFIIMDPVQEIFPGIDNKDDAQVQKVYSLRNRIRDELDCGLIMVHHTNKQGKEYRGVTTWLDLVDTGFLIEAPDEKYPALVELHPRKNRFGSKSHSWTLQLKEQMLQDPRLAGLTSVYMTGGDRSETETGDQRINDLHAWLILEGPASHNEIGLAMGFKVDNYLTKLAREGKIIKGEGKFGKWRSMQDFEAEPGKL